jgi:uncharacterized protein (DUF885 family)
LILVQFCLAGCQPEQSVTTELEFPASLDTALTETALTETAAPQAIITEKAIQKIESTQSSISIAAEEKQPELPFDQFVDDAFARLLQNDPEWATADGVARQVGADETRLTDLSEEGILATHELQRTLLQQLQAYPREALTHEQQLTYDVFEWYLDDLVRGQEFALYDYPINQLRVLSVHYLTEYLFTDQHTIANEEDARAYLARLGQVGQKLENVLVGLERREKAGIIPPRRVIEASLGDIQIMASSTPKQTPYYTALLEHMSLVSSITPETQRGLLNAAEQEIETSVLPAYRHLASFLEGQRKRAPLEAGLWQYPKGDAYYRYLLRHHTTTALSPDEIHQLGLNELARLHAEMRRHFEKLGYPPDASINNLYIRVSNEGGTIPGEMVLTTYKELISEADSRLDEAFDKRPTAELDVRGIPAGMAFYAPAPVDGSRAGIFFVPVGGSLPRYAMPTLAYHEALPGHHFQISLAREQDLPLFRNLVVYGAHAEGWGMYAEHLAGELGWYSDDPYGDLGRLQSEAFRAARLVVDTGLHAKRWTFDQAVDFLVENTGLPYQQMASEVTRYIAWPGQATSYEVGLLKLLEMRQDAQDRLGDRFDLKTFHNIVLQTGSLPLEVLERVLTERD